MPGDRMLDLDWHTCSLDNQKYPSYLSRCDLCDKRRVLNEKAKEMVSKRHTDR